MEHYHSLGEISEPEEPSYDVADCVCSRYPCLRICPCGRMEIGPEIVEPLKRMQAETYGPQTTMVTRAEVFDDDNEGTN